MANLLTVIAVDVAVVRTWQRLLDNIKTLGLKQVIESKPEMAQRFGLTPELLEQLADGADMEPWLIPPLQDSFKSTVREQFVAKMTSLDPLTQVGAIAFDDDTETADDFASLSVAALTDWAYTKGNNAILSGGVKRGKTNFALLLAEMFLAQGWIIVANVKVQDPPENFHFASTLSEMLRVICQARLDGKKVLIILDEGGIFWAKIDTVLKQNRSMAKMVLTYGKLDANLLTIHHFSADTPTILARTTVADFEKTSTKNVHISIRDGVRVRARLFTSVPPTKLHYKPEEIQMFTVNLPMERMFDMVSRLPDGENQWTSMLKIIDQLEMGTVDDITEKDVAIWLREKRKLSEYKIADTIGTPRGTIHDWIAKSKLDKQASE
jgi:DNA-binding transcriptional regulator YiaG